MMQLSKIIGFYIVVLVFCTLVFIYLIHSALFLQQKVLFYRGIIVLATSALITIIFACFLTKWLNVNWESMIAAVIVSLAIHLSLFILFPVSIDRSLTFYLLTTLGNRNESNNCTGYSSKELEEKIINEYFIKKEALKKRINEQSILNFVQQKNNSCIYLTEQGRSFLNLTAKIKALM